MIDWDNISVDVYGDTWYAYDSKGGSLATGPTNSDAFEALLKLIGE